MSLHFSEDESRETLDIKSSQLQRRLRGYGRLPGAPGAVYGTCDCNLVTFGASAVLGTSGIVAKLLALPTFCIVVIASRLLGHALRRRNLDAVRVLLILKLLLLVLSAWLAVELGPFADGDSWKAALTGLCLIAAMAIQNKFQRIHLSSLPPSTLMTGTTTQVMVDLADLFAGLSDDTAKSESSA